MPHLTTITMGYVFIGKLLLTLFKSHATILISLTLTHVYANSDDWGGDGLPWVDSFTALLATTPLFPDLGTCIIESTPSELDIKAEAEEGGEGNVRTQILESGTELMYAEMDTKYGSLDTDYGWRNYKPEKAEMKARDWKAYEEFMGVIVARNGARAGGRM